MHSRPKEDLGSLAARTDSTHSTHFLPMWQPRCSNQMTNSTADISSNKDKQGSLRKAATRNIISYPLSLNLRKTLPVIAITPAQVMHYRASPTSPAQQSCQPITSTIAFNGNLRKLRGNLAMRPQRQWRLQNISLNQIQHVKLT